MSKQHIVFIVADATATGGIERVITHLASSLVNEDYFVEILSVHRSNENIAYEIDEKVKITYVDKAIKKLNAPGSFSKMISHFISSIKFNRMLLQRKRHILIMNSFPIAFMALPVTFFSNKTVVVEHVFYSYYNKIIRIIRNVCYRRFKSVVTLTARDAKSFHRAGVDSIIVPNPLSFKTTKFADPERTQKKIIAVGRLEHQKGFDLLIEAFASIEEKTRKNWSIDIYGEGSLRQALEVQITARKLQNSVFLKGITADIANLYAEYDFFVFSSRFEGFGMVLLEAMSCGLPCISMDCPTGPKEILDDGKYGILCKNGDLNELKENMISLMYDSDRRKYYSEKSLERSQVYHIQSITHLWQTLFTQLSGK